MERWKIVAIVLVLVGMVGYRASQNPPAPTSTPDEPPASTSTPLPPDPKVQWLVGKAPPAWNIPAPLWMNSKPVSLADLKGSIAIIEFFRIKCSHCEEAAPVMTRLYQMFREKQLKMVAIQAPGTVPEENDWKQVQRTVRDWGVTYPVAFDEGGKIFKNKYSGNTYPTVLALDRQGIVRLAYTGHSQEKAKALYDFITKELRGNDRP